MSDRLSPTAKHLWVGVGKAVSEAMKAARPSKLEVFALDGSRVKVARPGQAQDAESSSLPVLKTGVPEVGDRAVTITLDSGEKIVLGTLAEGAANFESAEIFFDAVFESSGISTTTQNPLGASVGSVSVDLPEGTWDIVFHAVAQIRTATNGAGTRFYVESDGTQSGHANPQARSDVDIGVAAAVKKTGLLPEDNPHVCAAYIYTANGSNTTCDTIQWFIAAKRVG